MEREQRYWIKELCLYVSDRQSLLAGEWLTDAIINCAQTLLKRSYPIMGGLQMTTLGNTLAYTIERGEFVQILNIRQNHWITVTNIGCSANHYNIYDSIPSGDIPLRAIQQICSIIFSDANKIQLNFPAVQSQRGGNDCGLFSIAFAVTLCSGFDPSDLQYDQQFFRSHLMDCIKNRCITPFPCTKQKKKRHQTIPPQVITLFCYYRQPEDGKMVQCDRCDQWFHEECVDIPSNICEIEWSCPTCKK